MLISGVGAGGARRLDPEGGQAGGRHRGLTGRIVLEAQLQFIEQLIFSTFLKKNDLPVPCPSISECRPCRMAEAEVWRMARRLAAKLEDKERLTTIAASLDLTSLEALLAKQLKGEDIPSLLAEYRRFLVIKVVTGDISTVQRLAPSPLVEKVRTMTLFG